MIIIQIIQEQMEFFFCCLCVHILKVTETFGMNEHRTLVLLVKTKCVPFFLRFSVYLNIYIFLKQTPYISVVKSVSLVAPGLFEGIQCYLSYINRLMFQH